MAEDSLQLIRSIAIDAHLISSDKFGNIYIAKNDNTVFRYNNNGDSTGFYNSIRRGKITQIDATNPMRILVYYADIPMLTVLDRMMSEKVSIDFKKIKIYNCPAISYSADGSTWAYDAVQTQMIKLDDEQANFTHSFNFLQLFQTNIQPIFITEQERTLFVIDTLNGILKFDQFGNYITTYHFSASEIQYIQQQIVYFKNGFLFSYHTQSLVEKKLALPEPSTIINARIERDRVFVLRKNRLDIYNYKQE
jgi:hypothetical protein